MIGIRRFFAVFLVFLVASPNFGVADRCYCEYTRKSQGGGGSNLLYKAGAGAVGAAVAVFAAPAFLGWLGFTSAGIAGGSIGAGMMSAGGGATPWVVSVFQSIGAGGMGMTGTLLGAGTGIVISSIPGESCYKACKRKSYSYAG